jgi:hypothetical protein
MVSYWLPVIRAELEIHRKNPSRALEMIEPGKPGYLARFRRASLSDLPAWGGAAGVASRE